MSKGTAISGQGTMKILMMMMKNQMDQRRDCSLIGCLTITDD